MGALGLRGVFPWTPGVTTPSPKDSEGNWDWSFSPKKSKGSSCVEWLMAIKDPNQEGCPTNGLVEEAVHNKKGGRRAGHRVDSPWT